MNKHKARFISIYLKELRLELITRLECIMIKSHNKKLWSNPSVNKGDSRSNIAHSLPLFLWMMYDVQF